MLQITTYSTLKAPILHQQRKEYEQMSLEVEAMATQITSLIDERDNAIEKVS
jgi:cell division protein FtsB